MVTNISQVPSKAKNILKRYEDRLKEIRSINLQEIRSNEIYELSKGFEMEMDTLDGKKSSILSTQSRESLKERYWVIILGFRNIVRIPNIFNEMERIIAPIEVKIGVRIINRLSQLYKYLETIISSEIIPVPLKDSFTERYHQHIQKITLLVIDDYLPIDYKDSLFYIERTLAEPSLYSLNGLIMWKETAEQKIDIIQNRLDPKLPKPIESVIVKRYESLRLRLKAEILKMRTYPIPEPWCSDAMKERMTHLIEGEFIFYVCPEIEEHALFFSMNESNYRTYIEAQRTAIITSI